MVALGEGSAALSTVAGEPVDGTLPGALLCMARGRLNAMAAQGLTNPEIAQDLFVARKVMNEEAAAGRALTTACVTAAW